MRPVFINKRNKLAATTKFKVSINCHELPDAENVTIELKRVGGGSDTYIYPALEVERDYITFMWDDTLYRAPGGRYQGIIKAGSCKPICVAVHLDTCTCTMSGNVSDYFYPNECGDC